MMMPFLPISPETPWLAPLAGFSDLPFRLLCREQGAAVACTEMISAKGVVYGVRNNKKARDGHSGSTDDLLATCPEDSPLVVQLFGAEPEFLTEATELLCGRGFCWFDLNMGCPVPKVTKTGAGAALLREPARAVAAAAAVFRSAGPGRAGCKLRLGWDAVSPVYIDLAKALEDAGAAWITLHPRYARQGFSGEADTEAWEKLVRAVSIPVLASGDLFRAKDALRCLSTGVSGVMFARGAMTNPAIFRRYHSLYRASAAQPSLFAEKRRENDASIEDGNDLEWRHRFREEEQTSPGGAREKALPEIRRGAGKEGEPGGFVREWSGHAGEFPDREELLSLILRHAALACELTPGKRGHSPALLKMRAVVPRYTRHLPGVKRLRPALARCRNWDEFSDIIRRFCNDTGEGPDGAA
ncbi:MAG: tRNA-dihydrouridine synthase family protein [Desulfovibrio sp.]|jgi:tRNA-dihydrouridine synthase B|nr:tRNA-dihydrouridine synthase family protein [Desulfovibrio sp.]